MFGTPNAIYTSFECKSTESEKLEDGCGGCGEEFCCGVGYKGEISISCMSTGVGCPDPESGEIACENFRDRYAFFQCDAKYLYSLASIILLTINIY
mgnify:CR=1 FL=1